MKHLQSIPLCAKRCMAILLLLTTVFSCIALPSTMPIQAVSKPKVLIAYFGRYGNTNFSEDVDAATSASIVLDGKKKVKNMKQYDIIFLGCPIWAMDAPQAIKSFIREHNLKGKTVIPFCTHGGSGQSGTYKKIQKLCSGADTLPGFAVSDENVKTKATRKRLKAWLKKIDVGSRSAKVVPITITIGSRKLDGVCYNRPTKKAKGNFYNQSNDPDLTMRVHCVGRVTGSLSSFRNMGDSVKVTFALKK